MSSAKWIGLMAVAAPACVIGFNAFVNSSTDNRPGVDAIAHAEYAVVPTVAVFDIRDVDKDISSKLDVLVSLVEFNRGLAGTSKTIKLQNGGDTRFTISTVDMDRFQIAWDANPCIATALNFSSLVRAPDGSQPYPGYTGGWLSVLQKKTDDLHSLLDDWLR